MPIQSRFLAATQSPRVLAHRGFCVDAPENSLRAFLAALIAGADIIETDVRATDDGVAVCAHDATLERLADRPESIAELPYRKLEGMQLGERMEITSLAAALDAFPDTVFNIDIKSDDAVIPTVRAIQAVGARDRVIVTSFAEERRRRAAEMLLGVASGASVELVRRAKLAEAFRSKWLFRRAFADVQVVQVPLQEGRIQVLTPRLIDWAHEMHIEVHAWTINDEPTMRALAAGGIDGIVTDRTDLAVELLR